QQLPPPAVAVEPNGVPRRIVEVELERGVKEAEVADALEQPGPLQGELQPLRRVEAEQAPRRAGAAEGAGEVLRREPPVVPPRLAGELVLLDLARQAPVAGQHQLLRAGGLDGAPAVEQGGEE